MTPATIGPYTIERELGRGGMGVVYLGNDTRLDRQVAIKALPEHLVTDADRLTRFQREAKVLASLNHPGIAAIYGLEQSEGQQYLVLEYVEGETLDAKLARGSLPVDEALDVARRIAEALEAAHDKGVIHRDLKPGNVMVTPDGTVKVLDFGLARSADGAPSTSGAQPNSPTIPSPPVNSPTIPGAIMGTAGYMSPEQARGKTVDKRSDIFSFGCVVYEMLTGAQPFAGETVTDSLGAILHREPEWSMLPPNTPSIVRLLLKRCLAKDRQRRLQSIADARVDLEDALDPRSATGGMDAGLVAPQRRNPLAITLGALLLLAVGAAVAWVLAPKPQPPIAQPVSRFIVEVPAALGDERNQNAIGQVAVSPDGRRIVMEVAGFDDSTLAVRDLDSLAFNTLPGTDGATNPVFSPDGRWVAFNRGASLFKVPVEGGSPMTLCSTGIGGGRMTWLPDGTIVCFAPSNLTLLRAPDSGGQPQVLARAAPPVEANKTPSVDAILGFNSTSPWPDPDFILVDGWNGYSVEDYIVMLLRLSDGSMRPLVRKAAMGMMLGDDILLFLRGSSIMAVRVDVAEGRTIGPERMVLDGVLTSEWGDGARIAVGGMGTLASVPGGREGDERRIVRVDASGTATPICDESNFIGGLDVSPDGKRVCVLTLDRSLALCVADVQRGVFTSLDSAKDSFASVWHPDGRHLAFTHEDLHGRTEIRLADTLAPSAGATLLARRDTTLASQSWSPDGKTLLVTDEGTDANPLANILVWREGQTELDPLFTSPAYEDDPAFSPDGKWIAYVSTLTGSEEVYVCPFPDDGQRWRISDDGGSLPEWSHDGSRLFFVNHTTMYSAAIDVKEGFNAAAPGKLFDMRGVAIVGWHGFAVAPDDTFIMLEPAPWERNPNTLNVVLNWDAEVRRILDEPQ